MSEPDPSLLSLCSSDESLLSEPDSSLLSELSSSESSCSSATVVVGPQAAVVPAFPPHELEPARCAPASTTMTAVHTPMSRIFGRVR